MISCCNIIFVYTVCQIVCDNVHVIHAIHHVVTFRAGRFCLSLSSSNGSLAVLRTSWKMSLHISWIVTPWKPAHVKLTRKTLSRVSVSLIRPARVRIASWWLCIVLPITSGDALSSLSVRDSTARRRSCQRQQSALNPWTRHHIQRWSSYTSTLCLRVARR